jgi:hypothetical protein
MLVVLSRTETTKTFERERGPKRTDLREGTDRGFPSTPPKQNRAHSFVAAELRVPEWLVTSAHSVGLVAIRNHAVARMNSAGLASVMPDESSNQPLMPDERRLGTRPALWASLAALAIVVVVLKVPTLNVPTYWDEMGWFRQAHYLEPNLLRAIPGLRPAGEFWGHPPGLQLILATLGRVFGVTITTAHALIAAFAALGVCSTFLLARHWYGVGTAWLASLLLLLSPVYFAQSGMFLADLPITALGALAMWFVLTNRYGPYVVCATAMVFIKETAIAMVVAMLIFRFVFMKPLREARIREVVMYSIPVLLIGAFFVLQKLTTGEFFFIYDFDIELFQLTPAHALHTAGQITRWLFFDQGRIGFSVLIALNLLVNRQARQRRELWLFAAIVLLSGYSFSVLFYLPRYVLPVLPLFYILGAQALFDLARVPRLKPVAAAVALGAAGWLLVSQPFTGTGETSPRYLDVVSMHRSAIDRIATEHPDARVLSHWPHTDALLRPLLGYVKAPINVSRFSQGTELAGHDLVLVSHPADSTELQLRERARDAGWHLLARQEVETAWVEVYVPAQSSPRSP